MERTQFVITIWLIHLQYGQCCFNTCYSVNALNSKCCSYPQPSLHDSQRRAHMQLHLRRALSPLTAGYMRTHDRPHQGQAKVNCNFIRGFLKHFNEEPLFYIVFKHYWTRYIYCTSLHSVKDVSFNILVVGNNRINTGLLTYYTVLLSPTWLQYYNIFKLWIIKLYGLIIKFNLINSTVKFKLGIKQYYIVFLHNLIVFRQKTYITYYSYFKFSTSIDVLNCSSTNVSEDF